MPAAVYVGEGRIEVQQVPVPSIAADEVLVEVSHCGICGTDLHLVLERFARPGTVLGHEWSGVVVKAGLDAPEWSVGEPVTWNPTPPCGTCRACRRDRPSVCLRREPPDLLHFNGAFCRYLAVPGRNLAAVPRGLDTRVAALAEPTAIAVHSAALSGVEPDDRVLVTGGGPVGQLVTAVLRAQGVHDITVTDPAPLRRERALTLGASATLEPDVLGPAPMGRAVANPFTVAFECSGRADAAERALDQLQGAGTLVLVGTGSTLPRLNHNRMIVLELSVIGAYNYDAAGFAPALELLASGALPVDLLVEPDDVPLGGLAEAMRLMADGEVAAKPLASPHC
jgi:(R,R)-butanediol dehydrogenase / meso-butanediol dehydrogenase / diacetyl reductase